MCVCMCTCVCMHIWYNYVSLAGNKSEWNEEENLNKSFVWP